MIYIGIILNFVFSIALIHDISWWKSRSSNYKMLLPFLVAINAYFWFLIFRQVRK